MSCWIKRRKIRLRRCEAGATAVEAALILPVFLLLLLGLVKFGTALWQWNTMLRAVEHAGRYAMINNNAASFPNCTVTTPTLTSCTEQQMTNILSAASVCTSPSAGEMCVNASTSSGSMTLSANYSFSFFGLAAPFTISTQNSVPLD